MSGGRTGARRRRIWLHDGYTPRGGDAEVESLSGVSAAAASFPLCAARTSRDGCRLDLDHDARLEKALDAE
jgi:hypothetical protein